MQEEHVAEDQCPALAASCVHGSMEVLEAVLLLLLASLISLVLLISVIISGQLMAAQRAGIGLAQPRQNAVGMEEVMARHLNGGLLLLKFQKTHGALELSLRAPDDCPGKVLNCSLGSGWRQVVIPIYYQPQVFKVHPIEKGPCKLQQHVCSRIPFAIQRLAVVFIEIGRHGSRAV